MSDSMSQAKSTENPTVNLNDQSQSTPNHALDDERALLRLGKKPVLKVQCPTFLLIELRLTLGIEAKFRLLLYPWILVHCTCHLGRHINVHPSLYDPKSTAK